MPAPSNNHDPPPIPSDRIVHWLEARNGKRRRFNDVIGWTRYGRLLIMALALTILASGLWSVVRGWQAAHHPAAATTTAPTTTSGR